MTKPTIHIDPLDYHLTAIRSSGPGGQHVNKVATGIMLTFDIHASALSDRVKLRLLKSSDSRINQKGVIQIKATQYRSQEQNKKEAIRRLKQMILKASVEQKKRIPTKPSKKQKEERLKQKARHSEKKASRRKIDYDL